MSRDPVGFGGGDWNLYRYVGNGPVSWIDPAGLVTIPIGLKPIGFPGLDFGGMVAAPPKGYTDPRLPEYPEWPKYPKLPKYPELPKGPGSRKDSEPWWIHLGDVFGTVGLVLTFLCAAKEAGRGGELTPIPEMSPHAKCGENAVKKWRDIFCPDTPSDVFHTCLSLLKKPRQRGGQSVCVNWNEKGNIFDNKPPHEWLGRLDDCCWPVTIR